MQYTRKDYMQGKCTHREYYGQFVNVPVKNVVSDCIGENIILHSTDPHLNDIPLKRWDNLNDVIRSMCGSSLAKANGTGGVSLSDTVCVAKEAAKQIQESHRG